jgi:sugar lactone lactonase YvrE
MRLKFTHCVFPLIIFLINSYSSSFAQIIDYEMLVSSRNTNSVKRFNGQNGEYIDDFVPANTAGLSLPQDIRTGPEGNILVSGRGNTSILMFDKVSGDFIQPFTSGYTLDNPTKITFGPDGNLYVSQWGTMKNKVVRFNGSTGEFIDEFTPSLNLALGHAWDSDGNLYVACYGSKDVRQFDTSGNFSGVFTEAGHLQGPTYLWFDGKGNLFVEDWILGSVIQFNASTGVFIKTFISGLTNAEGYAFGPDSNLYLCDWTENKVNRYSPDGTFIDVFSDQGNMVAPNSILFRPVQTTSVNDETGNIHGNFFLNQNYPNPFNPNTTIKFTLNEKSNLNLVVYDQTGQAVETLFKGDRPTGSYTISWNPQGEKSNLSSGIYFLRMSASNYSQTIKMVYLK